MADWEWLDTDDVEHLDTQDVEWLNQLYGEPVGDIHILTGDYSRQFNISRTIEADL